MLNLLSNAVKFTPRGGRVTVAAGVEAEGGLAIAVRDTGIGIPADALARILEPFQQADSSIPGRFGGTGLGLSICRDLMALHGGSLSIDSEPGCGTVVTIRFPPTASPSRLRPAGCRRKPVSGERSERRTG
ncbi:ATP-binding protein [Azospirillum sp. INR13]|uniref:ATP-binding protein n=1 Tax=Azospirillum sp. INR13 TaxID=2596919 RepID=UPI002101F199|nr:ATP-binding protein [Azospirillum sp. INR13]